MPIYEYACGKCDHEFEVEQRITEEPVKTCPACRSRKVKRLISKTSFSLKGGGWYSDLYSSSKGDAKKGETKSDEKPDGSGGGAKDSGKDSKKESKTDSKSPTKSSGDSKSGSSSGKSPKAAA